MERFVGRKEKGKCGNDIIISKKTVFKRKTHILGNQNSSECPLWKEWKAIVWNETKATLLGKHKMTSSQRASSAVEPLRALNIQMHIHADRIWNHHGRSLLVMSEEVSRFSFSRWEDPP